jgi:hypothetical protein
MPSRVAASVMILVGIRAWRHRSGIGRIFALVGADLRRAGDFKFAA